MDGTSAALWSMLALWLLAGLADYLCHRRTGIEATSGWRESALHLLQWLQIALPAWAMLTLRFGPALVAVVAACLFAHSITAWWDTAYAGTRRRITPFEQKVHGFLEVLPLLAAVLVFCHVRFDRPGLWTDAWTLGMRDAWRDGRIDAIAGVALLLALLPLLEEVWRGWRRR